VTQLYLNTPRITRVPSHGLEQLSRDSKGIGYYFVAGIMLFDVDLRLSPGSSQEFRAYGSVSTDWG